MRPLISMKGATEELFVKATNYQKREGLGSPQWHFTMHIPQCFSQNSFLEKRTSEKFHLNFSKYQKILKKTDLCLQNVKKKQHTTLRQYC